MIKKALISVKKGRIHNEYFKQSTFLNSTKFLRQMGHPIKYHVESFKISFPWFSNSTTQTQMQYFLLL